MCNLLCKNCVCNLLLHPAQVTTGQRESTSLNNPIAKIQIVDLAGSEDVGRSGAVGVLGWALVVVVLLWLVVAV